MIIDFHTHIFPEKIAQKTIDALAVSSSSTPYTNGTTSGIISHMEKSGVDVSVSLPVLTKPTQFDSVVAFAMEVNEIFKDKERKIISFAGIHPKCEDIKGKMALIKKRGFLGVKIHPDYQDTYIDDQGYIDILNEAKTNDLIVVTHSGVDDGYKGKPVKCPPKLVSKVIDKTGHKKFVLAHYGGNRLYDDVLKYICGKDVYIDTAYTFPHIEERYFREILKRHGEDRILFATDSPWQDMKNNICALKSFNLGKEIEDKIFYKNAIKLLNL